MTERAVPAPEAPAAPLAPARPPKVRTRPTASLFEPSIMRRAAGQAFIKLDPRRMIRVPVMFVVEIGSVITSVEFLSRPDVFVGLVTLWLWATVLFANFAEAVAEGRGKAQADTLRRGRQETVAHLLRQDGGTDEIPSTQLRAGNLCVVTAGQVIPGDGDVVEGMAVVDESAITGESAPVIRESGGDRSAVTGGTVVLSDRIVVQITSNPGETFLDRMIALVEGASRQKTPNEIALDILIAGLTLILLVAVVTLQPMAIYDKAIQSTAVLVALFVCLAPTTIGGLLSAIGIAGMDRMVQRNVLAMSGRAVEAAGDCSTLLLDKTGTITYGNRMAAEFIPVSGVTERELGEAAYLSSMADETPEGRSIVDLAESRYPLVPPETAGAELVPFSAQTRMSGIDLGPRQVRKGAADSVRRWVQDAGGTIPRDLAPVVQRIAAGGGTPLVVADGPRVLPLVVTGLSQLFFHKQANGSLIYSRGKLVGSALLGQEFTDSKGNPLPRYFQPRPSAAGAGYDGSSSGATNLGPSNPLLIGFVPGVNTVGRNGEPSAANPFATTADPACVPTDPQGNPVTSPSPGQKYAKTASGGYVCDPNTVPERAIAYRQFNGLPAGASVPVDAVTASGSGLDPDISVQNALDQAPRVARARHLPASQVIALVHRYTQDRQWGFLGERAVNVLKLNLALDGLARTGGRA